MSEYNQTNEYCADDFGVCIPQQKTMQDFEAEQKREQERQRAKKSAKWYALRQATLIVFVIYTTIYAGIFTYNNIKAYNKSFDNCVALLEQIEANTAILDQEIADLRASMQGMVDYE